MEKENCIYEINLHKMKQSIIAILSIVSLTGCMKVLTTHTQVMNTYKNKEAVVVGFGQPTEKSRHGGMEEWIYNFGKINKATSEASITTANVSSTDSSAYKSGSNISGDPVISDKYRRYVKFTFDSSGEVKKWDSKRVDYTKTGPNKKATAWAIVITVAVLGLIVYGFSHMAFMP
jgi:hypothetical protein